MHKLTITVELLDEVTPRIYLERVAHVLAENYVLKGGESISCEQYTVSINEPEIAPHIKAAIERFNGVVPCK